MYVYHFRTYCGWARRRTGCVLFGGYRCFWLLVCGGGSTSCSGWVGTAPLSLPCTSAASVLSIPPLPCTIPSPSSPSPQLPPHSLHLCSPYCCCLELSFLCHFVVALQGSFSDWRKGRCRRVYFSLWPLYCCTTKVSRLFFGMCGGMNFSTIRF